MSMDIQKTNLKTMKYLNCLLDIVLFELYQGELKNNNFGCWTQLNEILIKNNYSDIKDNIVEYLYSTLSNDGHVIYSVGNHEILLTITSFGKRFCQTSSYSQPGVPIIK